MHLEEITAALATFLKNQQDQVLAEVYTRFQVENCSSGECMLFKNAYDKTLSGDLYYMRPYGHIEQGTPTGTTHGTGYDYDTHVPLLFFGKNVKATRVSDRLGTHQIIGELQTFFW